MSESVIEIIGLNYKYPDGAVALENIYLDILMSESVGIIGSNGAGKSTMLLQLNGTLQGEGGLRIFNLDMNEKNLRAIRAKVGLVFQDPDNQLFMPTVFDDVAFGPINMGLPKNEMEEAVNWALDKVGMTYAAHKSSNHLSFGEKKRVSIATVLSMKPEILALDEPTSNLDPRSRHDLIELLKSVNGTKIIASHDLGMICELCDRVVLLNKGRIVSIGPTKGIIEDTALLKRHDLIRISSCQ